MIRYFFAIIVLLLALSPFTAPFQTCDARQAIAVAAINHDDDPGSLVAPLVPKTRHTLIAPPALISEGYPTLCVPPAPLSALANGVPHQLLRPTILRI